MMQPIFVSYIPTHAYASQGTMIRQSWILHQQIMCVNYVIIVVKDARIVYHVLHVMPICIELGISILDIVNVLMDTMMMALTSYVLSVHLIVLLVLMLIPV